MYNFSVHLKVISTDYFTGITQSRMNAFACQYIVYLLRSVSNKTYIWKKYFVSRRTGKNLCTLTPRGYIKSDTQIRAISRRLLAFLCAICIRESMNRLWAAELESWSCGLETSGWPHNHGLYLGLINRCLGLDSGLDFMVLDHTLCPGVYFHH